MSAWAAPGVKIVAVDVSPTSVGRVPPFHKNEILTISVLKVGDQCGRLHVGLAEYPRFVINERDDAVCWWLISRFKPLAYPEQSLEHDVAQFLKIADRAPAPKKRVRA